MKPLAEFIIACLLILVAGCSAIVGIFQAGVWTVIFAVASVIGLVFMFTSGSKNRQ
jgi:drug/metabolite transporter (DMT)-like permease